MSISEPVNEGLYFHIMALAALVANPRRTEIGTLLRQGESLCLAEKLGIVIVFINKLIGKPNMDEAQQFKCLTDLREIINQLDGYYARPTARGSHPTIYPSRGDGPYRTVMGDTGM